LDTPTPPLSKTKIMKEVIRVNIDQKEICEKPVLFTHLLDTNGWRSYACQPSGADIIVYLGCCTHDGDMFAVYDNSGLILIYKGHLNSGKY